MKKYRILVLSTTLSELLVRLINDLEEFEAVGISSVSQIDEQDLNNFDILLIGAAISGEVILKIQRLILANNYALTVVEHYGGGSGLLKQELYDAINKNRKEEYETKNK